MACKLGGEPWAVDIPLKKTMVVGYDTYHDTVDKKKSVGAFVATLNDNFTRLVVGSLVFIPLLLSICRFISSCDLHEPGQELTSNIRPAMLKALRKYKEVNGYPPEKIFMFRYTYCFFSDFSSNQISPRDGVGDGQIPHVKEQEVAELLKVFHESGMPDVKFTCVLVSKRINTKFFRGNDNPHSGKNASSLLFCFYPLILLRNGGGQCGDSAREVRLLPGQSVCAAGNCQPHQLQRHPRRRR